MQTFFRILITTLTVTECQLISHRQEMTAPHMRRICVYFYDAHSLLHRVAVSRVSVYTANLARNVCKLANARLLCLYKILLVPNPSIFSGDKGDIKLDWSVIHLQGVSWVRILSGNNAWVFKLLWIINEWLNVQKYMWSKHTQWYPDMGILLAVLAWSLVSKNRF